MRSLILLLLCTISFLFFACNNDEKGDTVAAAVVDSSYVADSVSLTAVIDSLHIAFKEKSIERMNQYFDEGGLFLGTDPTEFWTRDGLNKYLTPSFEADSMPSAYTVSKRAITMSGDRKSAVVIDQFSLPFSPKLPVRAIAFAEFVNNKWTIKMFSWNFIANNDDVKKLNDVLK